MRGQTVDGSAIHCRLKCTSVPGILKSKKWHFNMTVNNSQLRVVDQKNVPYELENEPF